MPAVARGDSVDQVMVPSHGNPCSLCACLTGSRITTDTCSPDVFINVGSGGAGQVREGDKHVSHASPTCPAHTTPLDVFSPNVFANNRGVGRLGDIYDLESGFPHNINSGSPNVFANGS